jgi:predicted nucleic acid-binding Zn ribbon protein
LHEHPGCGGAVEKLVSAAALKFKGSGWYVNDYGKNGSSGGKDSGSKEKPKSESSSDSKKSDSAETAKPAAPAKETSTVTKSD